MLGEDIKERYLANPMGDFTGGLMAAIIALPLCLAFGVASGLGAAAGLYGAIATGIFAAMFGGTPGQCSGPTGPMTVVAASVWALNPGRPELVFAAVIVAGVIQIAMGYAKTGQFISYVPYPVISGFMTGIGAIIVCIELGPLFGLPTSGNALLALQNLIVLKGEFNSQAAIVGGFTLSLLFVLPLLSKRLPTSLIALVAATGLTVLLSLKVPTIGAIPSILPVPQLPSIGFTDLHVVLQAGLTLALLGSIDSLLTSVVLDKVTGRRHNSDRELVGQGIGNIASGLFSGLPGAGATMRSMVNVKSGGTTCLSGVIHGLLLLAMLLCFGNIASLVPLPALAAILLFVGINIMDWRVLRNLKKTPRADAFVMLVVLLLTMFVDLIVAVLVGVALASILFVKHLSDVQTSAISDLESLEEWRESAAQIPESVRKSTYSYVLNGPLFFGEAKNLALAIDEITNARYVILHFANVPLIDQTGAFALENAIEKWEEKGIKVLFVGLAPDIKKVLQDTGALHKIDMENRFDRFEDALEALKLEEKCAELEQDGA